MVHGFSNSFIRINMDGDTRWLMFTLWDRAENSGLTPQLAEIKIILRNAMWNISFFESVYAVYLRLIISGKDMPRFHLFFESMEKYLIGSVSKFQKFLEILSNENNMHRFCCFTGCLPKNVGSKIFLTNNILSTCIFKNLQFSGEIFFQQSKFVYIIFTEYVWTEMIWKITNI